MLRLLLKAAAAGVICYLGYQVMLGNVNNPSLVFGTIVAAAVAGGIIFIS